MAEVKRYVYWCRATHGHGPLEQDDGEFVLYEDYERLSAALERISRDEFDDHDEDDDWESGYWRVVNVARTALAAHETTSGTGEPK